MGTQNRRKHRRAQAGGIAADLKTQQGLTPCLVENISTGGLFIRTGRLMPVGLVVAVNLVRPGMRRALNLTGRIVNSMPARTVAGRLTPPGMGIAFDQLGDDAAGNLGKLLRELGVLPDGTESAGPKAARDAEAPAESKLLIQIRGVLQELGEAQLKLDANEKEIAHLKAENEKLRAQIRERDERLVKARVGSHHR